MKKIFLDTNIILDFLLKRESFFEESREIVALGYNHVCELYLSSLSFSNIAYIARKKYVGSALYECLSEVREFVEVSEVGQNIVDLAIALKAKDFEDAMQYFSAKEIGADCIVTRNVKDFEFAEIEVLTPHEFLERFEK